MESVAEEISPLWQSSFCGFTDHPELTIQPFLMFLSFYLVALLGSPGKSTGVGCHCLLRLRNVEMLILTPGDTQLHTPWASSWAFFPCRMPATSWSSPLRSWPHRPQPNGHLLWPMCSPVLFLHRLHHHSPSSPPSSPSVHSACSLGWPLTTLLPLASRWAVMWWRLWAYVWGSSRAILCTAYPPPLWWQSDPPLLPSPTLIKLASSNTTQSEIVTLFSAKLTFPANGVIILVSYPLIIRTILRVTSAGGKAKTFSTCTSYLTAFVLFATLAFMCQRSNSDKIPREQDPVFYTVVFLMLGPLTYNLRNKNIDGTIRKVICKIQFPRDVA